jgi:hypothetical protein
MSRYVDTGSTTDAVALSLVELNLLTDSVVNLFTNKISSLLLSEQSGPAIAEPLKIT